MKDSRPGDLQYDLDRDLYTVTEVTEAIRQHLESEFPRLGVIGEIANFKIHTSGHAYFTLRDGTNTIHAVLFRRHAESLAFAPENGMLVIASGRISHFGGTGQTQIIATDLLPAGRGALELEFRKLLQRLMDEGLSAPERKRPLRPYPERIAVITSPTGAVIKDILDALRRRWPVARVLHICADVQGASAARSIVRAFEAANRIEGIDTVILARGGGSIEDLWTFNLEEVARAVAGSAHPVITGIGHEIDTTVADYVADVRAATPTAAAELATPLIDDVRRALVETARKITSLCGTSLENKLHLADYLTRSAAFPAIAHRMEIAELAIDARLEHLSEWWEEWRFERAGMLDSCDEDMLRSAGEGFAGRASSLAAMAGRLSLKSPAEAIRFSSESVKHLSNIMQVRTSAALSLRRKELAGRSLALGGLDPRGVLKRGYAYCTIAGEERIIPRAQQVSRGDEMTVHFYDAAAICTVREKQKGKPWRRK